MSIKKTAAKLLLYFVIEIGAMIGIPIRPDEIEKLMQITEPKVVAMKQDEDGDGDSEKRVVRNRAPVRRLEE